MKKNYLKTIIQSFYSASAYKHALENWSGYGLWYFMVVNIIVGALSAAGWYISAKKIDPTKVADMAMNIVVSDRDLTFEENITRFFNLLHQIPEIEIENGRTIVKDAQPYFIVDPTAGYDVAIIDTSGKYKDLSDTDALVLLTRDQLVIKNVNKDSAQNEDHYIQLNEIASKFNLDEQSINHVLHIVRQIPPITMQHGKIITADNNTSTITNKSGQKIVQIGPDATLNENSFEPMLAVSSEEIALKTTLSANPVYVRIVDITEHSMFLFLKAATTQMKSLIMFGIIIVAFPLTCITSFMLNIFMLTFYAFIAYTLARTTAKQTFSNHQIARVAAVAITPALIMRAALPHVIPSQDIIYFLISIAYLYYAVKSITAKQV